MKYQHLADTLKTHQMKTKDVIPDNSQEMIQGLVGLGILTKKVNEVIHTVAEGIGLPVIDNIDLHSVSHITLEGGIAAEMQLSHEVHSAGGMCTYSSPRTTILYFYKL